MKSGCLISLVAPVILLTIALSAYGQFSLTSAASTNTYAVTYNSANTDTNVLERYQPAPWIDQSKATNVPGSTALDPNGTNPIPLIDFEDVPITAALDNLARQGQINYILDPQIGYGQPDANGDIKEEPILSVRWEHITTSDAFKWACQKSDLVIVVDTNTGVVLLRNPGHRVNFVAANIYGTDTNLIPLVKFEGVPLSYALRNLVKQSSLKCIFSPQIGSGEQDNTEPTVSFRWENLTTAQALAALCENYDLNLTKYPVSGIIRIEPND